VKTRQAILPCPHSAHIGDAVGPRTCLGGMINAREHEGAKVIDLPSGDYCPHHPFGCDEPDMDGDV